MERSILGQLALVQLLIKVIYSLLKYAESAESAEMDGELATRMGSPCASLWRLSLWLLHLPYGGLLAVQNKCAQARIQQGFSNEDSTRKDTSGYNKPYDACLSNKITVSYEKGVWGLRLAQLVRGLTIFLVTTHWNKMYPNVSECIRMYPTRLPWSVSDSSVDAFVLQAASCLQTCSQPGCLVAKSWEAHCTKKKRAILTETTERFRPNIVFPTACRQENLLRPCGGTPGRCWWNPNPRMRTHTDTRHETDNERLCANISQRDTLVSARVISRVKINSTSTGTLCLHTSLTPY